MTLMLCCCLQGAAPELINSRAAMLGFVLAVLAFAKTGKNIFEQIQSWPQPVFAVFALIAVGTLVPILRFENTCQPSGVHPSAVALHKQRLPTMTMKVSFEPLWH